jgi:hypothetical protein
MNTSTNKSTNQSTTNGTFCDAAPAPAAALAGAVNGCHRHRHGADGNAADASSSDETAAKGAGPALEPMDDEQFNRTAPRIRREGRLPGQTARDAADREAYDEADDEPAVMPAIVYGRELRPTLHKLGHGTDWDDPPFRGYNPDPLLVELACDVTEAPTAWLWPGRIPLERLTLLAGDDDGSASLVAYDVAARVSRAAPWPDEPPTDTGATTTCFQPARYFDLESGVLYCTTRFDRATTCVPGLAQAGAQMDRLLVLDGVLRAKRVGGLFLSRPLQLPRDIKVLREALTFLENVRLIVFDPIETFFDPAAGRRGVREGVAALRDLAFEFGVAIVGVTRLKGNAARQRRDPELANAGLAGEASAAWAVVREPCGQNQFRITPIKMSVGKAGPPLIAARADGDLCGRLEWEVVQESKDSPACVDSKLPATRLFARNWLKSFLSPGPRSIATVQTLAAEVGITPTMLRKVKRDLRVKPGKMEFGGKGFWRLPENENDLNFDSGVQNGERGSTMVDFAEISNVEPLASSQSGRNGGVHNGSEISQTIPALASINQ